MTPKHTNFRDQYDVLYFELAQLFAIAFVSLVFTLKMRNNYSLMNITSSYWDGLPFHILYILQFFTIGVGNIILVISILRYKALRGQKEYLVLLGLFLADSINLSGFLAAGLYRINLLLSGKHEQFITVLDCSKKVHVALWASGISLSSMMLVVVALDRLIAVCIPLKYRLFGACYAICLVCSAYIFSIVKGFTFYMLVLLDENIRKIPVFALTCDSSSVAQYTNFIHHFYHLFNGPFFAALSIVLYGSVLVVYRLKCSKPSGQRQKHEINRQRRLIVSLGISSICTLVFVVIPIALGFTVSLLNGPESLSMACFVICNLNPLCNLIIYFNRHKELRQAVKGLFICEKMPEQLRNWN